MRFRLVTGFLVIAAACSPRTPLLAQYEQLLNRVPNDANTLIIIDVERLLSAPLAVQEKWKGKHADDFSQGRVFVPPQAQRMVLAGRLGKKSGHGFYRY